MPFAVGISLNSLHTSTLTCLVSSFKEKALFCVCGLWLHDNIFLLDVFDISRPAAVWSGQTSCSPTPKCYIMKFSFWSSLWRWGDQELRRAMPVTATYPFHNSRRAILPEGVGFFSFSSNPFQRVCGRKPCALLPLPSWVKLRNCTLCQYQL